MERFAADPRLGLAGGVLTNRRLADGPHRIVIPRHHVHGALKCYTRECFAAIGGVQERLGGTRSTRPMRGCAGLRPSASRTSCRSIIRRWGTADGALRGRARLGECAYITQYPPSWVVLRAVKLAWARPRVNRGPGLPVRILQGRGTADGTGGGQRLPAFHASGVAPTNGPFCSARDRPTGVHRASGQTALCPLGGSGSHSSLVAVGGADGGADYWLVVVAGGRCPCRAVVGCPGRVLPAWAPGDVAAVVV